MGFSQHSFWFSPSWRNDPAYSKLKLSFRVIKSMNCYLVNFWGFNFHVDDTTDTAAANFLSLLESFDLQQHVRSCTHRAGHTLDLVITRDAEYILNAISVDDSSEISDHYTVCADLRFVKPNWERKRICGRKLKAINLEQLFI